MKFNKKMIVMLCSVIAVILVIIVVLMLITGGRSKVLTYSEIEEKVVAAGKNYYATNKDKLPESGTVSIDTSTLVLEGYLNDLSKYTEDGVSCSGKLYVTKNPTGYSYRTNLDCGTHYTTKDFKNVIMNNLVTVGNGLYQEQQVDPNSNEYQNVYVFKGDNVNNYIKVGDFLWQVVKVFENGEMMILGDPALIQAVWDDRYNIDTNSHDGINNYAISRMYDFIDSDVVNNKEGFLKIKNLITTHTACIGSRYLADSVNDGSVECSDTLENQYFSLLPAYDFINASLDKNCDSAEDESCYNYNYLTSYSSSWWTITAVADKSSRVYYINDTLESGIANRNRRGRLVAYLDSNVTYVSGTGSYEDPYILK